MTEKFVPFLGDFHTMKKEYMDKGKFMGRYMRDLYTTDGAKPLYYMQFPNKESILVNDVDSFAELNKLIPIVLDREAIDNSGFGRIGGTGGLGEIKSTPEWRTRRETLMKTIGINHTSKFIPMFMGYMEQNFSKIEVGEVINFSQMSNTTIFSIIQAILYGKDIHDKCDPCNYECKDGSIKQLKLYDCVMEICEDCESVSMKMINVVFPQLIDYNIGPENRRIARNNDEIARVLKKFLQETEDKTSVYYQVVEQLKNKDQVFQDCISLLVGGHETTFLTFSSALYCLKKYPECYKKLMAELKEKLLENGKYEPKDVTKLMNPEKLDELEYLSIFLKEVRFVPFRT